MRRSNLLFSNLSFTHPGKVIKIARKIPIRKEPTTRNETEIGPQ